MLPLYLGAQDLESVSASFFVEIHPNRLPNLLICRPQLLQGGTVNCDGDKSRAILVQTSQYKAR